MADMAPDSPNPDKQDESNLIVSSSLLDSFDSEDVDDGATDEISKIISPQVAELLDAVPKDQRPIVQRLLLMNLTSSAAKSSPIESKIEPGHIDRILLNRDRESQRELEKAKALENTRRMGLSGILILVAMVLVFAGVSGDKVLPEKILLAGISGLGGFGAGVAVGKKT